MDLAKKKLVKSKPNPPQKFQENEKEKIPIELGISFWVKTGRSCVGLEDLQPNTNEIPELTPKISRKIAKIPKITHDDHLYHIELK